MRNVIVTKNLYVTSGETSPGMQARMAEFIDNDEIAFFDQRWNGAQVCEIATAEDDGRFRALDVGELLLQALVERVISGHETRCASASAETLRCLDARFDDIGVLRKAEVIVASERDQIAIVPPTGRRHNSICYDELST